MNKTHQLLIRACKSTDPHKRLRSVYRRQYGVNIKHEDWYIAGVLASICDMYAPISVAEMIYNFHPNNSWKFGGEDIDYYTKVVNILCSRIRLAEVAKFPGLTTPVRFKKHFTI